MRNLGGSAGLVEFSFESVAAAGLPPAVFLRLARELSCRNARAGLTGLLRFEAGRFHQTIEGPCDTVLPLAARILADSRHRAVRVQAFGAVERRAFANWSVQGFDLAGTEAALADNLRVIAPRMRRRAEAGSAAILSLGGRSL